MFYVVPLFCIALLLWVEHGAPRPPLLAGLAALVAAALPGALPYSQLIDVPAQSDTLALLPWWWLQDNWITLDEVPAAAVLVAILLATAFLAVPRRHALALPVLALALFVAVQHPIETFEHGVLKASEGALFQGETVGDRDWIDAEVGRDADVAVVWSGRPEEFTVWENEFFSRSLGDVYYLGDPLTGGLPQTAVDVGRRDGLLRTPRGQTVRAEYALTDESVPLEGRRIADDPYRGLVLYRVGGPLRWTTYLDGVYGDTWSGSTVRYTRLGCRGGRLAVVVAGDNSLFERPQTLVARAQHGRTVLRTRVRPADERRTVVVPLEPRGGVCRVRFDVSPTKIPAQVLRGNTDRRRLGLHFLRFRYLPPGS